MRKVKALICIFNIKPSHLWPCGKWDNVCCVKIKDTWWEADINMNRKMLFNIMNVGLSRYPPLWRTTTNIRRKIHLTGERGCPFFFFYFFIVRVSHIAWQRTYSHLRPENCGYILMMNELRRTLNNITNHIKPHQCHHHQQQL